MKLWMLEHTVGELIGILLAEFFGTAILMFVGCLACAEDQYPMPVSIILPAFGFAFAIIISVLIFQPISGAHINPAVTVGVVVLGKATWDILFFYIPVQYLGSFFGYTLIYVLIPEHLPRSLSRTKNGICVLSVHSPMEPMQVFALELIGTFILVWIVCSLVDPRNADKESTVAVRAALAVVGIVIAIGPFSGAGINPARALSPSVLNGFYEYHWIFQAAPYLGGLLAGLTFRFIFDLTEKYSLMNAGSKAEIPE